MSSTPNYTLLEEHTVGHVFNSAGDLKTLPAGAFIRPIELQYVPKHIREKEMFFNSASEVYCYTSIGIVAIPRAKIRATR